MSVSQGGRSLRNKAPIDYTSCFYKNKLSRNEARSQKSDEELATRPRKKKQKLSQESETSPEDIGSDKQRSGDASEPLLDRTNKSQHSGGDARRRSKDATKRKSSTKGTSPSTISSGQEGADENADEQQQRASGSKRAGTDDAQPARKRGKPIKKKQGTYVLISSWELGFSILPGMSFQPTEWRPSVVAVCHLQAHLERKHSLSKRMQL